MQNTRATGSNSFSLSALFILTTAMAVVWGLISPVARAAVDGDLGVSTIMASGVVGAALCMLLGALSGLQHFWRWRGVLGGVLTGATVGIVAGPLVLAPADTLPTVVMVAVIGSGVLLLVAIGFRLTSR